MPDWIQETGVSHEKLELAIRDMSRGYQALMVRFLLVNQGTAGILDTMAEESEKLAKLARSAGEVMGDMFDLSSRVYREAATEIRTR